MDTEWRDFNNERKIENIKNRRKPRKINKL